MRIIKTIEKKRVIRAAAISAAVVAAYVLLNGRTALFLKIIDGITLSGVGNILIGLYCIVRNDGFFRLLRGRRPKTEATAESKTESITELKTETDSDKPKQKLKYAHFFAVGIPFVLLAIILIMFYEA